MYTDKYITARERLRYNFSKRVLKNGRLITPLTQNHGKVSTYQYYGCRCIPCTKAQRDMSAKYRNAKNRNS